MLLTDRFTYIQQPRTGGTFVATILSRLHRQRGQTVRTIWFDPAGHDDPPEVDAGTVVHLLLTAPNQHGGRKDIPSKYLGRPIVAIVANPYSRYVSQYRCGWWRVFPEMFGPIGETRRRCPAFPELTFEEFVELSNNAAVGYQAPGHPDQAPGFFTQQFTECFLTNPESAYAHADDDSYAATVQADLRPAIRFLDVARLGDELAAFLEEMDYSPDEVRSARTTTGALSARGHTLSHEAWRPYYTPDLKAYVRRKERWLFEWFPEFDL